MANTSRIVKIVADYSARLRFDTSPSDTTITVHEANKQLDNGEVYGLTIRQRDGTEEYIIGTWNDSESRFENCTRGISPTDANQTVSGGSYTENTEVTMSNYPALADIEAYSRENDRRASQINIEKDANNDGRLTFRNADGVETVIDIARGAQGAQGRFLVRLYILVDQGQTPEASSTLLRNVRYTPADDSFTNLPSGVSSTFPSHDEQTQDIWQTNAEYNPAGGGSLTSWSDWFQVSTESGPAGTAGWSPILAVVSDGERRVLQLTGWTGGGGTIPSNFINYYVGTGNTYVQNISEAVDVRGARGARGTLESFDLEPFPAGGDRSTLRDVVFEPGGIRLFKTPATYYNDVSLAGGDIEFYAFGSKEYTAPQTITLRDSVQGRNVNYAPSSLNIGNVSGFSITSDGTARPALVFIVPGSGNMVDIQVFVGGISAANLNGMTGSIDGVNFTLSTAELTNPSNTVQSVSLPYGFSLSARVNLGKTLPDSFDFSLNDHILQGTLQFNPTASTSVIRSTASSGRLIVPTFGTFKLGSNDQYSLDTFDNLILLNTTVDGNIFGGATPFFFHAGRSGANTTLDLYFLPKDEDKFLSTDTSQFRVTVQQSGRTATTLTAPTKDNADITEAATEGGQPVTINGNQASRLRLSNDIASSVTTSSAQVSLTLRYTDSSGTVTARPTTLSLGVITQPPSTLKTIPLGTGTGSTSLSAIYPLVRSILRAGNDITITPNDQGNTLTIGENNEAGGATYRFTAVPGAINIDELDEDGEVIPNTRQVIRQNSFLSNIEESALSQAVRDKLDNIDYLKNFRVGQDIFFETRTDGRETVRVNVTNGSDIAVFDFLQARERIFLGIEGGTRQTNFIDSIESSDLDSGGKQYTIVLNSVPSGLDGALDVTLSLSYTGGGESGGGSVPILTGTENPTNDVGENGQLYVNTATDIIFFKTNNAWDKVGDGGLDTEEITTRIRSALDAYIGESVKELSPVSGGRDYTFEDPGEAPASRRTATISPANLIDDYTLTQAELDILSGGGSLTLQGEVLHQVGNYGGFEPEAEAVVLFNDVAAQTVSIPTEAGSFSFSVPVTAGTTTIKIQAQVSTRGSRSSGNVTILSASLHETGSHEAEVEALVNRLISGALDPVNSTLSTGIQNLQQQLQGLSPRLLTDTQERILALFSLIQDDVSEPYGVLARNGTSGSFSSQTVTSITPTGSSIDIRIPISEATQFLDQLFAVQDDSNGTPQRYPFRNYPIGNPVDDAFDYRITLPTTNEVRFVRVHEQDNLQVLKNVQQLLTQMAEINRHLRPDAVALLDGVSRNTISTRTETRTDLLPDLTLSRAQPEGSGTNKDEDPYTSQAVNGGEYIIATRSSSDSNTLIEAFLSDTAKINLLEIDTQTRTNPVTGQDQSFQRLTVPYLVPARPATTASQTRYLHPITGDQSNEYRLPLTTPSHLQEDGSFFFFVPDSIAANTNVTVSFRFFANDNEDTSNNRNLTVAVGGTTDGEEQSYTADNWTVSAQYVILTGGQRGIRVVWRANQNHAFRAPRYLLASASYVTTSNIAPVAQRIERLAIYQGSNFNEYVSVLAVKVVSGKIVLVLEETGIHGWVSGDFNTGLSAETYGLQSGGTGVLRFSNTNYRELIHVTAGDVTADNLTTLRSHARAGEYGIGLFSNTDSTGRSFSFDRAIQASAFLDSDGNPIGGGDTPEQPGTTSLAPKVLKSFIGAGSTVVTVSAEDIAQYRWIEIRLSSTAVPLTGTYDTDNDVITMAEIGLAPGAPRPYTFPFRDRQSNSNNRLTYQLLANGNLTISASISSSIVSVILMP